MDFSSLAESQQQQQQQQSQSDQLAAYDPAHAQAYEAYYAAYNHYYDPSAYQQQPYYLHENPSSSDATATTGGYYTAAPPDAACPPVDAAQIHHSVAHEGAAYASGQEQDVSMNNVSTGLNQAAAAALTQLSELAGSIDAAERVISGMYERHWHAELHGMVGQQPPPHYPHYAHPMPMPYGAPLIHRGVGGRTPYRSVGRRGGAPHRGRGGRGHLVQHPSKKVGGPPHRGMGHGRMGRGGGRQINQSTLNAQQPQNAPAQPSVRNSLLPVAWCDICRVDCNSLEILEQHKNGKRHKKTVQKVQQIQAQQKLIAEIQSKVVAKQDNFIQGEVCKSENDSNVTSANVGDQIASSLAEGAEASKGLATTALVNEAEVDIAPSGDNLTNDPTAVLATEQKMETDSHGNQMVEEQSNPPSDTVKLDASLPLEVFGKKRKMASFDRNDRFRGSKQKFIKFGPGGKYVKSFERPRDRPRERPRVCTVCNVTCDTLAVFECHLAGKKHISHVKRFQGQGAVYGPISVYIPPNQPSTYPNNGPEPVFYGLQGHEPLPQSGALQSQGMLQQEPRSLHSQYLDNHTLQQFYQGEYANVAVVSIPGTEAKKDLGHAQELDPLQVQCSTNASEAGVFSDGNSAFPAGEAVHEPAYGASVLQSEQDAGASQ